MTLEVSAAVAAALGAGRPVVALETSVLAQGLAAPHDAEAARLMTDAVRSAGAEPAWVWVGDGRLRIGVGTEDLERLMTGNAAKVARRDIPVAVASGGLGATTVSATLWAARRAGIEVAATGGIGGVHPGGRDVSADLLELGAAGGALVCSGPKSILDPAATVERLEELGVALVGYRCDRVPHFLVGDTDIPVEHRVEDAAAVARIVTARRDLGTPSTILVCNPCPEDASLERATVDAAVGECRARAEARGVAGKELTPFLLRCVGERTGGRSIAANLALLEANAGLAAAVAAALPHRTDT